MFTIITGSQFGDEGKGKIVDLLAKDYDIIARFQGGDNAGHTIIAEGNTFKLHIIPSGILLPPRLLIGGGTVMNPEILLKEITMLEDYNIQVTPEKLGIDAKTSIIMPYHIQLDELREAARTKKIGTTKRGIGNAYIDKIARDEIQLADITDEKRFKTRLSEILDQKKATIQSLNGDPTTLDNPEWINTYLTIGKKLKAYMTDVSLEINNTLNKGGKVLSEGAQGTFLDVLHGTQKYVTSSNTITGSACANLGVGPTRVNNTIGIVKAYITRVGEGPLPTELFDENGKHLQQKGKEYGTTTGRPRRCGWLDLPLLRKAINLNGYTQLILTKLDVLTGLKTIKICHAYNYNNTTHHYPPLQTSELAQCTPEYTTLKGWHENITNTQHYNDLPTTAKEYIEHIEKTTNTPITHISIGPSREQTINKPTTQQK